jgi:hypothetical protein
MDGTLYLLLFTGLLLLILYNYRNTDNFDNIFFAFNSTNITPSVNVDSTYSVQTKSIDALLDTLNKKNKNYNNTDIEKDLALDSSYSLYNKNIDFPLSKSFKSTITDYLVNNKIFNEKAYISTDLQNMYTKDKS